ncbi:hypothetical protein GCM10010965_11020 [Caldalkalibacillus thermarum]|uniref:sporulation histidine kinase inhibitor Sda n=1 Tax=Caldalkalibacillus thermarum TaxID=296745 RepID=UPI00166F5623|nr:sporulation histidine kinase inhibitor Sda [Caldalkalibacillus thermarum]GGK19826.1 hypothetical protein GCM10010965_11020 [Caldalkalibacillus thermarum]
MQRLSDRGLIEAYQKAKEIKCSEDFLAMLLEEIKRRNLLPLVKYQGMGIYPSPSSFSVKRRSNKTGIHFG